jgi:hypothetical protein
LTWSIDAAFRFLRNGTFHAAAKRMFDAFACRGQTTFFQSS